MRTDQTKSSMKFYTIEQIAECVDVSTRTVRRWMPGAEVHKGLWASNKGQPMDDGTIYDMVRRRTREALGFPVNLHRFRAAAGTLWSIHDPANVRGVKDLLGHASFDTTEGHYIMAQSRIAGRALAHAVGMLRK